MQPTKPLGVAELTVCEMEQLVGGSDCWCKSLVRGLGYAIGYAVGELVDAIASPSDSNSFLLK
jgi:hypothetical protein